MDCQSVTKFGVWAMHRIIPNSIQPILCYYNVVLQSHTVSSGEKLVFFGTKIPFPLQ